MHIVPPLMIELAFALRVGDQVAAQDVLDDTGKASMETKVNSATFSAFFLVFHVLCFSISLFFMTSYLLRSKEEEPLSQKGPALHRQAIHETHHYPNEVIYLYPCKKQVPLT